MKFDIIELGSFDKLVGKQSVNEEVAWDVSCNSSTAFRILVVTVFVNVV